MIVAIGLGPVWVTPPTVLRIIGHHTIGVPEIASWARTDDAIIWEVRLPRVLLGVIVGSALGVVGVTLQALVRNPLAEPYILGVSSGASAGAAAAILFGVGSELGAESVSSMAFLGALGALAIVLALARSTGRITPSRMLVAGVAVSYLLSATTSLLILFADSTEGARAVMFWLLGSLANADWSTLPIGYFGLGAGMVLVFWWRRRLDLLALGEDTAMASGVDPGRTRLILVVVVALCVGLCRVAVGRNRVRRSRGPPHCATNRRSDPPPFDPSVRRSRCPHPGLGRRRGPHGPTASRAAHRRRNRGPRRTGPRRARPKAPP